MKHLSHCAGIVLLLATSLLLVSCGTTDVEDEDNSQVLSRAKEAVEQNTAAQKRIEPAWDPTCDDNCNLVDCRDCLRGCREAYDGQQEADCTNSCAFCGHPCFC
jgi:hypothetical protein